MAFLRSSPFQMDETVPRLETAVKSSRHQAAPRMDPPWIGETGNGENRVHCLKCLLVMTNTLQTGTKKQCFRTVDHRTKFLNGPSIPELSKKLPAWKFCHL